MQPTPDFPIPDARNERAAKAVKVDRRRRKHAVTLGVSMFLTIAAVLMVLPFKYEAQVDILVRVDRAASPMPQVGGATSDQIVVTGVRPEDVATEISLLTSRQVAEAAYEALGPAFFADNDPAPSTFKEHLVQAIKRGVKGTSAAVESVLVRLRLAKQSTPREEAVGDLMKALQVSKSVRSDLISVAVRAGSPEQAQTILTALTTAYFDLHRQARAVFRGNELFRKLQSQTEDQMTKLGTQIEQSKGAISVFNFPLWIEQRTLQMASLRAAEDETLRGLEALAERLAQARAELVMISAAPIEAEPFNTGDLLSNLRAELGRTLRDMERDSVRFGAQSQQVEEIKAAVDVLRTQLRMADSAATERVIRQLLNEEALLRIKAQGIADQIAPLTEEMAAVSLRDAELRTLEVRRDALAASLAQVSEERMRSDWLAALDMNGPARITILDPVTASDLPVAPNKVVILLASAVVSALAGLALYILLGQKALLPPLRRVAASVRADRLRQAGGRPVSDADKVVSHDGKH